MGNSTPGAKRVFQELRTPELSCIEVYFVASAPYLICQTQWNFWELTIRDSSTGLSIPGSERWRGQPNNAQHIRTYTPPGGLSTRILLMKSFEYILVDGATFEQLAKLGPELREHGNHVDYGSWLGMFVDARSGAQRLVTVSSLSLYRGVVSVDCCPPGS
jgi:hypothetical protein